MNKYFLIFLIFSLNVSSCKKSADSKELYRIQAEDGGVIVLYDDNHWDYEETTTQRNLFSSQTLISDQVVNNIGNSNIDLRPGIEVTESLINTALEMKSQGWMYKMPQPKSPGADWTVQDRRTTWYNGYWNNKVTYDYSVSTPARSTTGEYIGDGKIPEKWRKGGRPKIPTELEWLLSEGGGIKPF